MQSVLPEKVFKIYPLCLQFLGEHIGELGMEVLSQLGTFEDFPEFIALISEQHDLPPFLSELARLELADHQVGTGDVEIPSEVLVYALNPTLQIVQLGWRHLTRLGL